MPKIVVTVEVDSLPEKAFRTVLESAEASAAKDLDGVKRDTRRFFVLDRRFTF